jgi:phosphate transport system substrate-binding protein
MKSLRLVLLGLMGLVPVHALANKPVVKVDGSSTVFPVTEAVSEEFQAAKKGAVQVTVGISGTGGGFKKFCRGEIDVQNASRPILKEEMEACKKSGIKYLELPVAFDAMVVAVNPQNTWLKEITVDELKKIWEPGAQGKIKSWDQVNPAWPKVDFRLFGAGSDSGTFDYFTEAIVGKAKSSRSDYTASEDDNTLVQGIGGNKDAIGYLPYSYYESNAKKLRAVPIVGGAKAPLKTAVTPSQQTVENGNYFPLSRPLFIYVADKSLAKPEVKEFAEFYLKNAKLLTAEVKYVALPDSAYALALEILQKARYGTVFGGEMKAGLTIKEVLQSEANL